MTRKKTDPSMCRVCMTVLAYLDGMCEFCFEHCAHEDGIFSRYEMAFAQFLSWRKWRLRDAIASDGLDISVVRLVEQSGGHIRPVLHELELAADRRARLLEESRAMDEEFRQCAPRSPTRDVTS